MIPLFVLLGILFYGCFQSFVFLIHGTTPMAEAEKVLSTVRKNAVIRRYFAEKQVQITRLGAGYFFSDGFTVSRFYLYKMLFAGCFLIPGILSMVAKGASLSGYLFSIVLSAFALFLPDLTLQALNKRSNDKMLRDVMEMSRSVLYAKRGGQYIGDSLRDAMMIVQNPRLKIAMIRMCNNLDSGMPVEAAVSRMELEFSNAEISGFATVIRSLQMTGQVDEALKTLENSIEREQISVNRRHCITLENTTMMYVMLVAVDILAVIVYCIVMKLMAMEMSF